MLVYIMACGMLLCLFVILVQIVQKYKMKRQIQAISSELNRILSAKTDEKMMLFTGNPDIIVLMEQINRVLESRQKAKSDYRKAEYNTKRMISNISHDIKTPLTVILGYLEIMRINDRYDVSMLEKVEKRAHQVIELISEFFTLAKIEAGDIDLTKTRIHVNAFCKESIVDFYEILTEKEFEVDIKLPENEIYVYSNKEALKRILWNLITNALRYGSDGKFLGMYIRNIGNFVCIDIMDKGKGIEEKQKEQVFERLYKIDDSRNNTMQGNGLGLTIAKELAEKIGGTIELESVPNEKTIFTLKLERMDF